MKFVDILERHLHLDVLSFPVKIDHLVYRLFVGVHILHEADNAVRFMKLQMFCLLFSSVFKNDGQFRVQISRLMEPAFHFLLPKSGLFKDRIVWQEIDGRTGLLRLPHNRQKTICQFRRRNSLLIGVLIDLSAIFNSYGKFF